MAIVKCLRKMAGLSCTVIVISSGIISRTVIEKRRVVFCRAINRERSRGLARTSQDASTQPRLW